MNTSNSFGALEFEYFSRKSRSKKKRKKPAKTNDQFSETETVDAGSENDEDINNDENDEENSEQLNVKIVDDSEYSRVTTDAQLKREPSIQDEKNNENEQNSSEYTLVEQNYEEIEEKFNIRALSKHAETYELEKFEKKALIIFNQENIDGYRYPRHGTEKDVHILTNTFEKFGFEVIPYKDLTKKEIFDILKIFCRQDFTDYGCIGVAVLTHGTTHGLINAKDQQYSEIEIIDEFKVHDKPTLVTKPKFLIIQACRGMVQTAGAAVLHSKVRRDQPVSVEPYILPVEADMLILHSSFIGTPSHRHELEGSWFVQSLCGKINQLAATHDLESIMTEVKKQVAIEKEDEIYNRATCIMQVNKQMPVMTSTLIRKLYLRKFGDSPVIAVSNLTDSPACQSYGGNDVMDGSTTPVLVHYGPCSCFLEHFEYLKNCFRFYLEECPDDEASQGYLEIADSLEEGIQFNAAKEKISKAMCRHLINNARHMQHYKYLYFYKHF